MTATEILTIVEDKFSHIQRQLDVQLRRTGEMQAQLDRVLRRLENPSSR